MALSAAYRTLMIDRAFAANATPDNLTVKLHTGDPGAAGTLLELSGGGYSAQVVPFGAGSSGSKTNSGAAVFTIGAGVTVAWVSLWDGAVFMDRIDVTDEAYGGAGTYTLPIAAITVAVA